MCIVHNLYFGYSLSAYVIISIIMIDQNKTFRSEKSARALPGQARVCRRLCNTTPSHKKYSINKAIQIQRHLPDPLAVQSCNEPCLSVR